MDSGDLAKLPSSLKTIYYFKHVFEDSDRTKILERISKMKCKSNVYSISALDAEHLIYGSREFLLEQDGITVTNLSKLIKKCKGEL